MQINMQINNDKLFLDIRYIYLIIIYMREIDLIKIGKKYTYAKNISLSRLGFLAAKDGKFFTRLEKGSSCTLRTARSVIQYLSDSWPPNLKWPSNIPRPPISSHSKRNHHQTMKPKTRVKGSNNL